MVSLEIWNRKCMVNEKVHVSLVRFVHPRNFEVVNRK